MTAAVRPALPRPTPPEHRHAALDGLRGMAVLAVMVMHFTVMHPVTAGERYFRSVLEAGWTGVDLFFVLSGFLITGILWDARGGTHYFRGFFMRRTLRIFPLYYAYLALMLVVLPLLVPAYAAEHVPIDRRPWLWGYLGNVLMARVGWEGMPSHTTHLWSLAVEEQFYLLWPFLLSRATKRGAVAFCLVAIAIATGTRVVLTVGMDWPAASYLLMPARLDSLAIGGLIAFAVREPRVLAVLARHARAAAAAFLALLVALAAWIGQVGSSGGAALPALDPRVQLLGYPLVALLCGALLVLAFTGAPDSPLVRALTTRPALVLGKYSYALYLFHVPLRNVVRSAVEARGGLPTVFGSQLVAQVALIVIAIGVSLAIAFCSWHFFERHFLRLKDRFPYDVRGHRPGAPAIVTAAERPLAS